MYYTYKKESVANFCNCIKKQYFSQQLTLHFKRKIKQYQITFLLLSASRNYREVRPYKINVLISLKNNFFSINGK